MALEFHDETYTVASEGRSITFLPKEYRLLRYMHEHRGRTLTRDQLLDAVWALEAPTDRTVDDHVYRVRRKLSAFTSDISIDTIRGQGYRLTVHERVHLAAGSGSSLRTDPHHRDYVRNLFFTYVRHGHGDGIQFIHQGATVMGLGRDKDLSFRMLCYLGRYRELLNADVPFPNKLFFLLSLYDSIQLNHEQSLEFFTRACDAYLLPTDDFLEALTFSLPKLHTITGRFETAEQLWKDSATTVEAVGLEGYVPLLRIMECIFALYRGDIGAAEEQLRVAESTLTLYPWQREIAYLSIVKGYLALLKGDAALAESRFDEGVTQLQRIGFINHLLSRSQDIVVFLQRHNAPKPLLRKYSAAWNALVRQYTDATLERDLYNTLQNHL